MAEKTEKATPKKLRDARRKGQVPKSQDFSAAVTFVVSIATTLAMAPLLYDYLGSLLINCLKLVNDPNLERTLGSIFYEAFFIIFLCSIPILLAAAAAGALTTLITVGPVWAPEVFKFDIKKFNPVDNLKQKFKMKTFIELLKSLFKIFVAGYIVYTVVSGSVSTIIKTVGIPLVPAMSIFVLFLKEVIIKVGLFFLLIAIFDLVYQKHNFSKEMKMEKFEVKQEYKDIEGNPEIKSKRRQIAQEIAYQDGPAAAAGRSKAVVTNPTNLAIAIDFDHEVDPCPFVVAMGQGTLAEQIIKTAEKNHIPIIRNISLARKLWEDGKLYEYIPEETYGPVAEILKWIASLQSGEEPDEQPT